MPLRNSIHSCLLADTRVTDLIGTGSACRHYPRRAPQGAAAPYVVSQKIAGRPEQTHGTPGDAEDTMEEALVQFSCIAATGDAADALCLAVRKAIMEDVGQVLATAHITATSPDTRDAEEDAVDLHVAQVDITFFHNPQT